MSNILQIAVDLDNPNVVALKTAMNTLEVVLSAAENGEEIGRPVTTKKAPAKTAAKPKRTRKAKPKSEPEVEETDDDLDLGDDEGATDDWPEGEDEQLALVRETIRPLMKNRTTKAKAVKKLKELTGGKTSLTTLDPADYEEFYQFLQTL